MSIRGSFYEDTHVLTRFLVVFVLILGICLLGIWLDHCHNEMTLRIARQHFQMQTLKQQNQQLQAEWQKSQSKLLLEAETPTDTRKR